jgi:transcriptional regulator with XRE-family HTH domain
MAKYELKIKAREMRSKSLSVRTIAKELGVAKSTASLWVRDIILTVEQLEKIRETWIKGTELGRLKGALMQKNRRLDLIKKTKNEGIKKLKNLSDNEFFVAGIALYWAEGSKKKREFFICNSDPEMIVFILRWINKFFGIEVDRLRAVVGINEIHRKREDVVKKHWSVITRIPLSQFRKTSFKKVKLNKVYANFNEHYGTLGITVLKGSDIYYKMLGLIAGLSEAGKNMAG